MANVEESEQKRAIEELMRKMNELEVLDEIVECVPYLFLPDGYLSEMCERNVMCVVCQRRYAVGEVVKFFDCGHLLHGRCYTELHTSKGEAVDCPICKARGWFPYIGNSELVVQVDLPPADEEDEEPTYPIPAAATPCKVCNIWFHPAERVYYIGTCQCFYHIACFRGAFNPEASNYSFDWCAGCDKSFDWVAVQECELKDDDLVEWFSSAASGFFAIAAEADEQGAGDPDQEVAGRQDEDNESDQWN